MLDDREKGVVTGGSKALEEGSIGLISNGVRRCSVYYLLTKGLSSGGNIGISGCLCYSIFRQLITVWIQTDT